jgi:hypothetical protein
MIAALRALLILIAYVAGFFLVKIEARTCDLCDMFGLGAIVFLMFVGSTYFYARRKYRNFDIPIPAYLKFWDEPLLQGNKSFQDNYDVAVFTFVLGVGGIVGGLLKGQIVMEAGLLMSSALGVAAGLFLFLKMNRGQPPRPE